MRLDHDQVHGLVSEIYESAEDPSRWASTLYRIMATVKANGAQLWSPFLPVENGGLDVARNVSDAKMRQDYANYFCDRDIWFKRASEKSFAAGDLIVDKALVSEMEFRKSEFWNDYLRPLDSFRMCTAIIQGGTKTESPLITLSVFRGERSKSFDSDDQKIIRYLVPHLQRAVRFQRRLQASKDSGVADFIDVMRHPVFILGSDLAVRQLNTAAETFLRQHPMVRIRMGRLALSRVHEHEHLRRLFSLARDGFVNAPADLSHVFPIHVGESECVLAEVIGAKNLHVGESENHTVILSLLVPNSGDVSHADLQLKYGLTLSEAKVAASLVRGEAPGELAAIRGVTINTVRSQIQRVYAKVGVNSQLELARKLGGDMSRLFR